MAWPNAGNLLLSFSRLEAGVFDERAPCVVLPNREAHVWAFSLDADFEVQRQCGRWLSPSEQERANRFRFEQDRNHFVVAHGCLRQILSRYCDSTPDALVITQSVGEKPKLRVRGMPRSPLMFNLTHSHGRGLVAVANGFEIGVDLERVREDVEHLKLAERFFSHPEVDVIRMEEGESQRVLFFRHWVGKEAMLKAKGTGLQFPLDRCALIMADTLNEAVVHWHADTDQEWFIHFLPLESGWVGAVAAEGTNWTVTYRGLTGY